ncbi:MAG TPA: glucosyltransferase domain-containing protein [Lachnospiraceae bacterium]|nr:glucosyltransferase domain-containing protein [Lachnospiraceae bacterium]
MIYKIEEKLTETIEKNKHWGIVFLGNMIISAIVYSLLMCNQLVNVLDGLWHGSISYAKNWELSLGRWFLRFLDYVRYYLSPDPLTSILTLALLSMAAVLMLNLFEVKKRGRALLISSLFLISSSICATLSFRYTSLGYGISCFLSILAAFLIIKTKKIWTSIFPIMAIAVMMGCYQANLGCTCLILLLYIPFRMYQSNMTLKELLQYISKAAITLILGGGIYYLILSINLKYYQVEMANYNGADGYGLSGMIINLPKSLKHAFSDFRYYFSNTGIKINIFSGKIYIIAFAILFLLIVYGFISIFKKNKINGLISLLCFALVPVACNVALLIAYGSYTSIQMTIPMALCIPALLCVVANFETKKTTIAYVAKYITTGFFVLLLYGNFIMVEYDQQAMYMGLESTKTLSVEISNRLLQQDLFHPYYQYCFVGKPSDNPLFNKNDVFYKSNDYARFGDFGLIPDCVRQSWYGLWTNEMGINVSIVPDDKYTELIAMNEIQQMPVFPEIGSCAMINDVVVIKVSETYTE